MGMITKTEKKFIEVFCSSYPECDENTIEKLLINGFIDFRRCKTALVRNFVYALVKKGCGKNKKLS